MDNLSLFNDVFIELTLFRAEIFYALLIEQSSWTLGVTYIFSIPDIKPIEEGLAGLALAPMFVVEVQVVPISMSWVDLQSNTWI